MKYLKNAWYCAGWTSDLKQAPISRIFLEEPVLMYRKEDGTPVAMSNRCPHRFAPLHKGKLKGDCIECPYHGLQFNSDGQCVLNPHGKGAIPKAARIKTYPIVEKQGALWVWMGDPGRADESKIVDTAFLVEKGKFASVTGHLHVEANYKLFIDNLLDLTHAPYLHTETLAGKTEHSIGEGRMEIEFRQDDDQVESNYFVRDMPVTPQLVAFWGDRPPGDFRVLMRWHAPSTLVMSLGLAEPGAPMADGIVVPVMHFLTPETATTTHYFFATGHNWFIDDEQKTNELVRNAVHAFKYEDEAMIIDCQSQMSSLDLFSLNPVLLETDVAAVRARRLLDELIENESRNSGLSS